MTGKAASRCENEGLCVCRESKVKEEKSIALMWETSEDESRQKTSEHRAEKRGFPSPDFTLTRQRRRFTDVSETKHQEQQRRQFERLCVLTSNTWRRFRSQSFWTVLSAHVWARHCSCCEAGAAGCGGLQPQSGQFLLLPLYEEVKVHSL